MKYIAVALLFLAVPVQASVCEEGCTPYKDVCACDASPVEKDTTPSVVPSDEKPPQSGMPSWQASDIHLVTEPPGVESGTTTAHDYQAERDEK